MRVEKATITFVIDASLVGPPPRPLTGDVGTGLLGGPHGFF